MTTDEKVAELVESFINGNRKHVVDSILEGPSELVMSKMQARATTALLAARVTKELFIWSEDPKFDTDVFCQLLANRAEDYGR